VGNDYHQADVTLADVLSLAEGARVSGITAHTLAQQAERGRLRGRKVGRTWITTRQWLSEYMQERARLRQGRARPNTDAHLDAAPSGQEV
jgi:hypothetical protein